MSRATSRSFSYSRSHASTGTSFLSQKSAKPDYHEIAIELIEGAPLDIVRQKDLKNVLIELSVLRSEANGVRNYVKSDQIKDIIIELNKRIIPPPIRHKGNSPRGSSRGSGDLPFIDIYGQNDEIFIDTAHPVETKEASIFEEEEEHGNIEDQIDKLIEAIDNPKKFNQICQTISTDEYELIKSEIKDRRTKCLNECRYKDLEVYDILLDKLHPYNYDRRIDECNSKIELLETRIKVRECDISALTTENILKMWQLKAENDQKAQKLNEENEKEINNMENKKKKELEKSLNIQSLALKELREDERQAALDRDYEVAERIHKSAEEKESDERDEKLRKFEENKSMRLEKLQKKHKIKNECLEQRFDYLKLKTQMDFEKDVDKKKAAIEIAKKKISYTETKKKRFEQSFK